MRRILAISAILTLSTILLGGSVVAHHRGGGGGVGHYASCTVTPSSGPAGSTFTAVCTGFPANQPISYDPLTGQPRCDHFPPDTGASITWGAGTSTQTLWYTHYCVATNSSGGFTTSQVIPIPSQPNMAFFNAQVRTYPDPNIHLYAAHVQFTVTP